MATDSTPIVAVRNLQTTFYTDRETIRAADGISFEIHRGETVGIVGESGSGKSVTARSLMGLIDNPGVVMEGSSIRFTDESTLADYENQFPKRTVFASELDGEYASESLFTRAKNVTPQALGHSDAASVPLIELAAASPSAVPGVEDTDCVFIDDISDNRDGFIELTHLSGEAQRLMRGGRLAMIFQDPLTSLNPVYTVGNQIKEALKLHRGLTGSEATQEAADLLEAVGIPDARRRVEEYPHQFSGGMRQRAVIAMAIACNPEVLICDEPTTALDVTIQAQILDLLREIQQERDIGIMFITHDMGVIAEVSDQVNVMYAGEIVETADAQSLFADPKHPYSEGLLSSIPGRQTGDRLTTIEGTVPTPNEPPTDCRFAPRCPKAFDECTEVHPVHVPVSQDSDGHTAACLLYPEELPEPQAVEYHLDRAVQEDAGQQVDQTASSRDSAQGGGDR